MKIGISYDPFDTGRFARFGEKRFAAIKACGFDALDYCLAQTETALYTASETELEALIRDEREAITQAGLFVSQVHGPWRCPPVDFTEEDHAERLEKMRRSMWMTSLLGCKNWVIHPIMPFGWEEIGTADAEKTWQMNQTFLCKLLQTANAYDLTICLENMPFEKFSISVPKMTLRFVQEMNNTRLRICFDTGHAAFYSGEKIGEDVRALGDKIRAFHIHDTQRGQDLHLYPFIGVIDWADFAAALRDIHFEGVFSLETAPSPKLSDKLFCESARLLANCARQIIVSQV